MGLLRLASGPHGADSQRSHGMGNQKGRGYITSYDLKKRMREKVTQRRHDRVKVLEVVAGESRPMSIGEDTTTEVAAVSHPATELA